MGRQLMEGIATAGRRAGRQVHLRGVPMVFHVSFNETAEVVDYRSYTTRDAAAYERFWLALQERGIRTIPGGLWFVSTAHTPEDVEQTLAAVAEAMHAV
jgi:glutamate-1-semialdehyde 2,1-aminomutase